MSVKRNIIAGWLAHAVTLLIGFFLMPYILGTLGESQYGAWLFINAVAGYSGLVYAGFGATICRFVSDLNTRQDWSKLNKVVSTIQAIYMGSALVVLLLTALFVFISPRLDKWGDLPAREIQLSILMVGSTIALGMVCSVYGGVLIGTQRLDLKRSIEVVLSILRLILVLYFLKEKQGLATLSLVFFAVTLTEQVLLIVFAYRQVPRLSVGPWHADRETLRECFGFSVFSAVAQAAEQLIYFTDTVVIGLFLGPVAVVPYQIALRITQMVQIPIYQIGDAVLPRAGALQAVDSSSGLQWILVRGMSLAFLLSGGFWIGAVYFGGMLIQVWVKESYPVSEAVLCILLAAQMVALPMMIARKTLLGAGHVRIPALIDLLEAVSNLGLSLVLIRFWGVVGVAWGTLIPLLAVEVFVLLPYVTGVFGIPLWELVLRVVRPAVLPLFGLLAYCEWVSQYELTPHWLSLLGITAGAGVVFGASLGLNHLLTQNWNVSREKVMAS